ncbi:MAG: DUF1320 domain-containing protein [Roseomonas mucosa]|nr:DUF1320 domain-containing protein [Roseomonas mucosa]
MPRYATTADLIAQFGEDEVVSLTTPGGQDREGVVVARAEWALDAATGLIESFLRRRYLLPLNPVPVEIVSACCKLARFDLSHGSSLAPSEQVRLARKDVIDWLGMLESGRAELAGATPLGGTSGAMVSDRVPTVTRDTPAGW